jgi:hypothetical protein
MERIRRTQLCEAFEGRAVLIVGDSLSYQTFASIVMQIGCDHEASTELHHHRSRRGLPAVAFLCGGKSTIQFVRNDNLLDPKRGEGIMLPFWRSFDNSDVVLFNRGAHYSNNSDFTPELRSFLVTLRARTRPHQLVFYRTTPPGHNGCDHFTAPGIASIAHKEYKWELFAEQNVLAATMAHDIAPGVASVIDVYNTTLARRDRHKGHGDCMHYCLPGPPDWWVQIFADRVLEARRLTVRRQRTRLPEVICQAGGTRCGVCGGSNQTRALASAVKFGY